MKIGIVDCAGRESDGRDGVAKNFSMLLLPSKVSLREAGGNNRLEELEIVVRVQTKRPPGNGTTFP